MDILVKIYSNYWSNTEKFNFFSSEKISIEENLDSFDIAVLKIDWYEVVEYNKIEIYEAGNPDVLIFRGLVHKPEKTISVLKNETMVTCRSEKWIMKDRKVLIPRTKTDTVENILTELFADFPTDTRTTSIAFPELIDLDYKVGTPYDTILDEIALQCGWYRDIKDGVVRMDYLLGVDRSMGAGMVSVVFTGNEWDNIKNINIVWQSTRANIVVWENWWATHTAQDMTDWIVYWVVRQKFISGNLVEKTEKLLERLKVRQRILNIALDPNKNIAANLWDKLHMEISNVNWMEDIQWPVLVIKRTVVYDYARKRVLLHLWESIVKWDGFLDIIVDIKREVDMLD